MTSSTSNRLKKKKLTPLRKRREKARANNGLFTCSASPFFTQEQTGLVRLLHVRIGKSQASRGEKERASERERRRQKGRALKNEKKRKLLRTWLRSWSTSLARLSPPAPAVARRSSMPCSLKRVVIHGIFSGEREGEVERKKRERWSSASRLPSTSSRERERENPFFLVFLSYRASVQAPPSLLMASGRFCACGESALDGGSV